MRLVQTVGIVLSLTLLGCPVAEPAREHTPEVSGAASSADPAGIGSLEVAADYPAAATAYLAACLQTPTQDGHAALGPVWLALSRLQKLGDSPTADPVRSALLTNLAQAKEQPLPLLCAAWLALEPTAAEEFIAGQLTAGNYECIESLWHHPGVGIRCFKLVDTASMLERDAVRYLLLVRRWQRPADLASQLSILANHEAESVRLLAIGMLISCDKATVEQRDEVRAAVDDYQRFSHVAEAIKLSHDPGLADALVTVVAKVEMGDVDPEVRQHRISLAAYALTGLTGNQAELMRDKLLSAADPLVRWQARLGKLLNGQPAAWNAAVTDENISDRNLWIALQPEDVVSIDLLPTLAIAARSDDPHQRALAALQLNRYTEYASNHRVVTMTYKLLTDTDYQVRSAAWFAAATLGLGDLDVAALISISDEEQPPEVRLGAAFYAMRLAEIPRTGGGPE